MSKGNSPIERLKMGLGVVLLAAMTGCVGVAGVSYVDEGVGVDVAVPVPDVYVFGGDFHERGHEVREYSHRGIQSRAAVHHEGHERDRR